MTKKFKVGNDKQFNISSLAPYLGDIWSHFDNLRLLLAWKGGRRYINLCKSSEIMKVEIPYKITVMN